MLPTLGPASFAVRALGHMSLVRRVLGLSFVFAIALAALPRAAFAWVEAHVEADDVHVALERGGKAKVEHKITLRVAGGPLRSLDVHGVDADAAPDPDGFVVPQKEALSGSIASAVPVSVELAPPAAKPRADGSPVPPALKIRFGDRGLARGVYVLRVRYATDLAARIDRSGRIATITWTGAEWDDGIDTARALFDLPSAPDAPRGPERESDDAARDAPSTPLVLSSVRRGPMRDEIELVRPYAPKGEAVAWTFRADALAFAPAATPAPPKPKAALATLADHFGAPAQRAALIALAASLFVAFAALVFRKASEVARTARAAGTTARPLFPIHAVLRALGAGASLTAGVACELMLGRPILGATLVTLAAAFAAHRTPRFPAARALRGPGRWYPLPIADALASPSRPRGVYLDVSTRWGKALFVVALAGLALAAFAVAEVSPLRAELVALDVTALLAVFATGRLAELPPDPGSAPAPFLRRVANRLEKKARGARVVARLRMPDGGDRADELRLGVVPKPAHAGFVALEIGVVFVPGAGGAIALPEVLVRVVTGSRCEEAMAPFALAARSCRGRRPGERVLAFRPRLPLASHTADLAARLAAALVAPPEHPQRQATELPRRAA